MKDIDLAEALVGRTITNRLGVEFAVIDFGGCAEHDSVGLVVVPVSDGQPVGPVAQIDSIAGWAVGEGICICWAAELA